MRKPRSIKVKNVTQSARGNQRQRLVSQVTAFPNLVPADCKGMSIASLKYTLKVLKRTYPGQDRPVVNHDPMGVIARVSTPVSAPKRSIPMRANTSDFSIFSVLGQVAGEAYVSPRDAKGHFKPLSQSRCDALVAFVTGGMERGLWCGKKAKANLAGFIALPAATQLRVSGKVAERVINRYARIAI